MSAERCVVEGISGVWHYHIANADRKHFALCGAQTMGANIKLDDWGVSFGEHFPKHPTWCKSCASMANVREKVET